MNPDQLAQLERDLEKIYVKDNVLYYNCLTSEETVHRAIQLLHNHLEVNSIYLTNGGGGIDSGLRLISFIRGLNRKIDIKVLGYAASMGTLILASATGRKIIPSHSYLMYHQMRQFIGYETTGSIRDVIAEHEFLYDLFRSLFNPNNSEKLNEFLDMVNSTNKDIYVNSTEALDLGLVDVIEN